MDDLKKRDYLPKLNFNDKRAHSTTPQVQYPSLDPEHDPTHDPSHAKMSEEVHKKVSVNEKFGEKNDEDLEKKPEEVKESETVGPLEEILNESKIEEEKDEEITEPKEEVESPSDPTSSSPSKEIEDEKSTTLTSEEVEIPEELSEDAEIVTQSKRVPIDKVLEEVLQSVPEDDEEVVLPNANDLEECTSLPFEDTTTKKTTEDKHEEILNIILLKPGDGKNHPSIKTEPSENIQKISKDRSEDPPEVTEAQPEVTETQPEIISASEMEIEYFEEEEDEIQEVQLDQSEDENAEHDDDPIDLLVIKSDLSYLRDEQSAPVKRKAFDSPLKGPIKKRKMENLYSLIVQMLEPTPTPFSFNCHVNDCDFSANHIEDLESHIRNSHRTSETIRYRSQSQYLRFQCDKCGVR